MHDLFIYLDLEVSNVSSFFANASRSFPSLFNRFVDILVAVLGVYDDELLLIAAVLLMVLLLLIV